MKPPEHRVWDWLDRHRVPFREPADALVARFGTDTDAPSGDPMCRLDVALPLVPHQLHPLAFAPGREIGPPAPPRSLYTSVYDGSDPERSFHAAAAALDAALGPGRRSESVNVLDRVWAHGIAEVRLILWPEHLNRGHTYGYPDPLRHAASHLAVTPGWTVPLREGERIAMSKAGRIHDAGPGWEAETPAHLWRRHEPGMEEGIHLAPEALFVVSDRVLVFPRAEIAAVTWVDVRPAKGGGWSGVDVGLTTGRSVGVAHGPHGTLRDVAERIALWAGVSLGLETGSDD